VNVFIYFSPGAVGAAVITSLTPGALQRQGKHRQVPQKSFRGKETRA
jgi:hypothetical protein